MSSSERLAAARVMHVEVTRMEVTLNGGHCYGRRVKDAAQPPLMQLQL